MWIVRLALNRPYTFVVLALLLFLIAPVMLLRTPVDIFPEINIPVVSIIWTYTGLVPREMESRITSIYERALTTTVGDVDHIESQSLYGVSVIKVYLQPQANVDGAIAEVNAEAEATMKQLPSGITPPLVIRYSASTVPILQLGLSGAGLSEQQLNDFGTNFIRPQLATVPGAAVPLPFGGKVRQIMAGDSLWEDRIKHDIDAQLAAKGWTRVDANDSATIAAFQSTQDQKTLDTFYDGFGGGWRWRNLGDSMSTTTTEITRIGTLVVDIFDAQTQKLIWRGKQSNALSGNPQKMRRNSPRI